MLKLPACTHMAICVSVQYHGGSLPDIITADTMLQHWGTRLKSHVGFLFESVNVPNCNKSLDTTMIRKSDFSVNIGEVRFSN